MLPNPIVKGSGDSFLSGGKFGDLQDVTQEIGKAGQRLVVSLAKKILGDEKVRAIESGSDRFDFVGRELFTALKSLLCGIFAR